MTWNQAEFNQFVMQNHIIGFFKEPLKLKSGRLSYWYVNWRNIAEDVYLINLLSDFLIDFVQNLKLKPDCFYGVPEGATKLGVITQFKWAMSKHPKKGDYVLSMGRGTPKTHGDPKDKFFLGVPNGKVIVLEDVTTTGGSMISAIENLIQLGVEIIAAIGLTNRNELRDDNKSVPQKVSEYGITYHAMSNAIDLLPRIYKIQQPGDQIGQQIEGYFKNYGVKEIKLR